MVSANGSHLTLVTCHPTPISRKDATVQPTSRESLLRLAADGRSYAFLDAAWRHLARCPDDAEVRLTAVSHFGRLALFGPALELLDERPELMARSGELERAADAFRQQPSGRIDWAERAELFKHNLRLAAERFEAVRACERQLRDATAVLELYACRDGNLLLRRRPGESEDRSPGRSPWAPAILDWNESATRIDALRIGPDQLCPPWVIEGLALGHTLRRAFERTTKMLHAFTPQIHVIEPNLAQIAAWLHVDDHYEILTSERFLLWAGTDGPRRFLEYFRENPTATRPAWVIRQPGWGPAAEPDGQTLIQALVDESERQVRQWQTRIVQDWAGKMGMADYARRFARRREAPLRILGLTSRQTTFLQYSMRDIGHAAESAGHAFELLMEPDDHTAMLPREYILSRIAAFRPDLLIVIDHNRKEFGDTYALPVPYCNWIQDDLPNLFGPGCGEGLSPHDLVVGLIGTTRASASGYPPSQCRYIPTPVSTTAFFPAPIDESTRRELECDVSFVTNLSITTDEFLRQALDTAAQPEVRLLLPALRDHLEPLITAGRAPASPPQTVGITQEVARRLGFELDYEGADRVRQVFTDRLVNIFFRQQVLEWAAEMELDLHIYGRGWEAHPRLARYARGVAEHGEHLRAIYQASRINIQAMPTGAVHQRLLEGLCSGGFFLIRRAACDTTGELAARIRERILALGIRDEVQLWNTTDAALAADVRALNAALFAPLRLCEGFVATQYDNAQRGHPLEAGALLPHYDETSFATRDEFATAATRFLSDAAARAAIAAAQRDVVQRLFSYDAALERLLGFAEQYFARTAAQGADAGRGRVEAVDPRVSIALPR